MCKVGRIFLSGELPSDEKCIDNTIFSAWTFPKRDVRAGAL